MSSEERRIKVLSAKSVANNPVAFDSLMRFQYGSELYPDEEEANKEAEKVLFERFPGVACKNTDELFEALPNIDLWLSLTENQEQETRYILYMDGELPSLLAAKYLKDLDIPFDPVVTDFRKESLPILIDKKRGHTVEGLQEIKKDCRWEAMKTKIGDPDSDYSSYTRGGFDELGYKHFQKPVCFNERNEVVFRGEIEEAPYPVAEMLQDHWYVGRVGLKAFHEIFVWKIGEWETIKATADQNGHIIQVSPPTVLFVDEVKAFDEGVEGIVTDDHGCAYCVTYDGYFIFDKTLYRIHADMTD